ncbi:MAG: ribonuclease H-like domain-containing protein [Thermoplasmatota archaeon]
MTELPMIKEGRAQRLREAGIGTIEQLWKADLAYLAAHPAFEGDGGFLNQLPLLQGYAEAHAKGSALIYAADPRLYDLQEPIIHMDLEFDGPATEVFLYGMLDHASGEITQWFEHTRRGQEKLIRDFRRLCIDQRPTVVTWGGSTSDLLQLRRASEKVGLSPKWVGDVDWLDLQTDVIYTASPETQRVYLPVKAFKSEIVASFFGYKKPKLKVRDGYQALRLYRGYKRRPREQVRADLCTYNAEDIKHLAIILDGMRDLMKPHQ